VNKVIPATTEFLPYSICEELAACQPSLVAERCVIIGGELYRWGVVPLGLRGPSGWPRDLGVGGSAGLAVSGPCIHPERQLEGQGHGVLAIRPIVQSPHITHEREATFVGQVKESERRVNRTEHLVHFERTPRPCAHP
jgi:hypothetical protein